MTFQELEQKVEVLERRIADLEVNPFGGDQLNPIASEIMKQFNSYDILTAKSTYTPKKEGVTELVNVSGTYYFRAYINGGWRETTLT